MKEEILFKIDWGEKYLIVEENETSAWAYLYNGFSKKIETAVFLYSPIEPEEKLDENWIAEGNPPKLIAAIASDAAYRPNIVQSDFEVIYESTYGNVCIFIKGEPCAAIYSGQEQTYSKSLSRKSRFGMPWSNTLYQKCFKENKS